MSDDGANGRIDDIAGDHPTGVHEVRGEGVFINHLVIHGTHHRHAVHDASCLLEMLADTDARDAGLNGLVFTSGLLWIGLGIAALLGIKSIDLRHATSKPDEDAMLRLSFRRGNDSLLPKKR